MVSFSCKLFVFVERRGCLGVSVSNQQLTRMKGVKRDVFVFAEHTKTRDKRRSQGPKRSKFSMIITKSMTLVDHIPIHCFPSQLPTLPIKAEKSSEGINPGAERISGSCQSNPLTPSIPLLEKVESNVHPQEIQLQEKWI